ncbi:MAG: T9SS type A sorting domain-containing protein [Bacteroidota bacterium]
MLSILRRPKRLVNYLALIMAMLTSFCCNTKLFASDNGNFNSGHISGPVSVLRPQAPVITTDPSPLTTCVGVSGSFTVVATGVAPTYQWQLSTDGGTTYANVSVSLYTGYLTPTLTIPSSSVTLARSGYRFRCVVTESGSTNSAGAILTVNAAPTITVAPSAASACNGDNALFSITATGATAYRWQVSSDAGVTYSDMTDGGIYSNTSTSTLNITGVSSAINSYKYRCQAINAVPCTTFSSTGTFTLSTPPSISVQPANKLICPNTNTSMTITSAGTGRTFQWQVSTDAGVSFTDLTNAAPYSTVTTSTLNFTAAPNSLAGNQYRCELSGTCPTSPIYSNAATLNFNAVPSVTVQPSDQTKCEGTTTTFSVSATGLGTLTYLWKVSTDGGVTYSSLSNGANYTGVTSNSLVVTTAGMTLALNNNKYACTVSGGCSPPAVSNPATLSVLESAAISAQPANSTLCAGGNTSFSVTATGTGITYKWRYSSNSGTTYNDVVDGGIYSGASTSLLSLTGVTVSSPAYKYLCEMSVASGCVTNSAAATLTVQSAPSISTQPAAKTVCNNVSTSFTLTAAGTGLTYQWQVSTDAGVSFSDLTNVAPYSTVTTSVLNISTPSTAYSTYRYRCVVSGTCPSPLPSNSALLTVNASPVITSSPTDLNRCAGVAGSFTAAATGGGALTYQWKVSTDAGSTYNNVAGSAYTTPTGASLGITAAGMTTGLNGYMYECVVSGCSPAATSAAATLTVLPSVTISAQPVAAAVCPGANTGFSVTASGTGLTYKWKQSTDAGVSYSYLSDAGIFSGTQTSALVLTGVTSGAGNLFLCEITAASGCVVLSSAATYSMNAVPVILTNPANATICPNAGTTFAITASGTGRTYQWQVSTDGGTTYSDLANSAPYSGVNLITLTLTAASNTLNGNKYRCVLSGTCTPSQTSTGATLAFRVAPEITGQPAAITRCSGISGSFTVNAGSTSSPVYTWKVSTDAGGSYSTVVNGSTYAVNSASPTLTVSSAGMTVAKNGYLFTCTITSGNGCTPSMTSSPAALTVYQQPTVSAPTASTICFGANTSFSVTATGPGLTYQWQESTDAGATFNSLADGGIYSGALTATLNLTVPPVTAVARQYRCVVTATPGVCSVTSTGATLVVRGLPTITVQPSNVTTCINNARTFSVTATGSGLIYAWKYSTDGGANYTALVNNTSFTGVTTNILTITSTGMTAARDNYYFACTVSGTCTPPVTSNPGILTIDGSITVQPAATVLCPNANGTISLTATGTGLTYQWYESTNAGTSYNALSDGGVYSTTTTNTLTLTAAPNSMNNNRYRCNVTTAAACVFTSNAMVLTFNIAPGVTLQPTDKTICNTATATYTLTAVGTLATYKWQRSTDAGANYADLTNTAPFSGVTTASLKVTTPSTAYSGDKYRCLIAGTCTPSVYSNEVNLTVNAVAVITSNPSSQLNKCPGLSSTVTFNVAATGPGITYQWQQSTNGGTSYPNLANGAYVSGANTSSLIVSNLQQSWGSNYKYRCMLTTTGGCALPSSAASLTMLSVPTITGQPVSTKVACLASTFTISLTAGGTTPTYQWAVSTDNGSNWNNLANGGKYTNVTTAAMKITAVTAPYDGYQYRCLVGGTCSPSVLSSVCTLDVVTAPVISVQPASAITACDDQPTSISVTATGGSLTYQWQQSTDAGVTYNNLSNSAPFSGVTASTLNFSNTPISYSGYKYRCNIAGTCTPSVTSGISTLTVNSAPFITSDPSPQTLCSGGNTSFSAAGTGGVSSQWQVSTDAGSTWNSVSASAVYSGITTGTLTITAAPSSLNQNQYRLALTNASPCTDYSAPALLTVNYSPTISVQPQDATICSGSSTNISVTAGGGSLTYQWQLSTNGGTTYNDIVPDAVFSNVTASALTLTTPPDAFDSYKFRANVTGACNPATTTSAATLYINPSNPITAQPSDASVCVDNNTTFSLSTSGVGLSLQWQQSTDAGASWANMTNAAPWSGVNTNTLSLTSALNSQNNFKFRCVVSGACNAISNPATLSVNATNTWIGTTSDWSTGTNWTCGTVPSANSDVVITSSALNQPDISTAAPAIHNLNVQSGAGLSISTGSLVVTGNITATGAITATGGSISLEGLSLQTISGNCTFYDLEINNASGVEISTGGVVTVNNVLTFTQGVFSTGTTTLTLGSSASLAGEGNNSRILGKITTTHAVGTGSSDLSDIGFSIFSGSDDLGDVTVLRETGTPASNNGKNSISRTYTITITGTQPASGRNITFSWLSAEDNGKTETELETMQLWKREGANPWTTVGSTFDAIASSRSVTVNTTSFSEWTASDLDNPLPVTLVYFNAKPTTDGHADLNWYTANELNSSHFIVERSAPSVTGSARLNNGIFAEIGRLKAAGISASGIAYNFTDTEKLDGIVYYRLIEVDRDGTRTLSETRSVSFGSVKPGMQASVNPNPFNRSFTVSVTHNASETLVAELRDMQGRMVWNGSFNSSAGVSVFTVAPEKALPAGIYSLSVAGSSSVKTIRLVKE